MNRSNASPGFLKAYFFCSPKCIFRNNVKPKYPCVVTLSNCVDALKLPYFHHAANPAGSLLDLCKVPQSQLYELVQLGSMVIHDYNYIYIYIQMVFVINQLLTSPAPLATDPSSAPIKTGRVTAVDAAGWEGKPRTAPLRWPAIRCSSRTSTKNHPKWDPRKIQKILQLDCSESETASNPSHQKKKRETDALMDTLVVYWICSFWVPFFGEYLML